MCVLGEWEGGREGRSWKAKEEGNKAHWGVPGQPRRFEGPRQGWVREEPAP